MGYNFTLDTANIIANLSFGKVYECYCEIFSSEESFESFLGFLRQFQQNMITDEPEYYRRHVDKLHRLLSREEFIDELLMYRHERRDIEKIIDKLLEKRNQNNINSPDNQGPIMNIHKIDSDVYEALGELSFVFERCALKALLLPPLRRHSINKQKDSGLYNYRNDEDYEFMTSWRVLQKLVKLHPGNSCLILQPREQAYSATAFNAFPHFDVALHQADMWPAVLFWDGADDYAFVPVRSEGELIYIFEILRYERRPVSFLRRIAESKQQPSQYILQLSDLHFGAGNLPAAEQRLKALIKTQLKNFSHDDEIITVITGDGVDSPEEGFEIALSDFSNYIKGITGRKPIRILGNHDINQHGLSFSHRSQIVAANLSEFPRLEIDEKTKTILLLFNSNTNGSLAEGEVGTWQMSKMGNLLDDINDLSDYLLIAVLHHHVVPVPKPEYFEKKWYERIIPSALKEQTLQLKDAAVFKEWLQKRNVRIVLHGHKHIPFFSTVDGFTVIGCGSSTGQIQHKEKGKTCLSYNWLKISPQSITCTQVVETILGAGPDIRTDIINI